jgi:hypothetical protein
MQRWRTLPLLHLAVALLLVSAPAAPGRAQTADGDQPRPGFPYGVLIAHLGDAPLARDAGFRVMATTVSWRRTEPEPGRYLFELQDQWGRTQANDLTNIVEAARGSGMQVGLRLADPPPWAGGAVARVRPADLEEFVFRAVRHAGDALGYVEVFNEMNLPHEWGAERVDPAAYTQLLAAAYRGTKRANPAVPVINAGPSQRTGGLGGTMEDVDWLDGLYRAGGHQFVDALGVHAYLGDFDPAVGPECRPLCFGQVLEYRWLMEQHGDSRPMYVGEMGALEAAPNDLGQFEWMELPPGQRAEHLVESLRLANARYPWIQGATVFNLDYAWKEGLTPASEQFWFGLLNPDRSPREAYVRFQQARSDGTLP